MINPHPGLPELEYVKPGSLNEACAFLLNMMEKPSRSRAEQIASLDCATGV
jgi:hypothetical protein